MDYLGTCEIGYFQGTLDDFDVYLAAEFGIELMIGPYLQDLPSEPKNQRKHFFVRLCY